MRRRSFFAILVGAFGVPFKRHLAAGSVDIAKLAPHSVDINTLMAGAIDRGKWNFYDTLNFDQRAAIQCFDDTWEALEEECRR